MHVLCVNVCVHVFVNGDLPSAVWPVCVCTYVFVNGDLPSAVWPVCVCMCS